MSANSSIIRVSIVGDGQSLIRAFREVDDSATGFGGRMASFGPVVAGGLVAAGAGLASLGSQFNTMDNTIAVGTGAAGDALDDLEQSARNVLRSTSTNMGDTATAIADLNTNLGLTGQPLEDLSRQLIDVSRITGTDLSTNINTVSRAFGDWSVAAEDQAGTLDMLFRASQATGASVDTLAGQVVQFGAPMRGMGFSLEETTALLGSFERSGVNTELVMGSMRMALGNFAREGEAAPEALRRLIDEIANMEDPTQAAARAMEVFGARAGADMADTIRNGRFEIDDLVASLENSDGAISDTAAATSTLGDRMTILKNRVLVGLEPIASAVFDGLIRAMDILAPKAEAVVGFFQDHKAAAIALGAVVGGVLTAVMVAWTIQLVRNTAAAVANSASTIASTASMVAHKTATVAMAAATRAYTAVQWLFNAAMNANPVMLVVVAIAALAAGLIYAYTQVDWFREAVDAAFAFVVGIVEGAVGFIRDHWKLLLGILTGPIGLAVLAIVTYWDEIKGAVMGVFNWVKDNWKLILGIITGPIGLAVLAVTTYWDEIKGAFTGVKDWIGEKVGEIVGFVTSIPRRIAMAGLTAFDVVRDAATSVKDWISNRIDDVVGFVTGLPGRITRGAAGMFDGFREAFRSAFNWIIDKWNGLEFSMPSINTHIPGVGTIGGWTVGTPNIPRFDRGGVVQGPIGRPQLIVAEGGETILPTHRNPGAGGTTVVVHQTINVPPTANLRDVGREIARAQREYARAGGR